MGEWRVEFVMSSDTISPSRQQRSESIWNVCSTSNSLMPFALSLEQQIDANDRKFIDRAVLFGSSIAAP
jgi:hypothetical protein